MIFQFHTHRIIEVEANDEKQAFEKAEAEMHDDESVLSVMKMENEDEDD